MNSRVLAAVIAAVLVVGGGAFALMRLTGASEDEALAYVPQDAFAYANFFIRPSNSQKSALDELLQKFPGIDSTDEAIRRITDLLDDQLEKEGFDYEEDIDSWLGDQVAAYAIPGTAPGEPGFAVLVETTDEAALEDFVDEVAEKEGTEFSEESYNGETYRREEDTDRPAALAILDGFLVVGTEAAVKESIDTAEAEETLETTDEFVDATDPLRDDWIGLFYLDTAELLSELAAGAPEREAALQTFGLAGEEPQAGVLYVTGESVVFESSTAIGGGALANLATGAGEAGLLPDLPGEAWAAFGLPNLGETVTGMFDLFAGTPGFDQAQIDALFYAETGLRIEQDVLSWLGDAGLFVEGSNFQELGGGLVIESSDPAKTQRVVRKIEDLLAEQGLGPRPASEGDLDGFSIQMPGTPVPIYVLGGDRLIVAYGQSATEDAVSGDETLEDSDAFGDAQDAVGDDFAISFFVDVDAAQAFGESFAGLAAAPTAEYEEEVKPYLDVFTHIVAASKKEGDILLQKFVIGVE